MKINLTDEQIISIKNGKELIVGENERWDLIEELEDDMTENGIYSDVIYQQPTTNKYFRITLFWVKYGYKDYDFDLCMQNKVATEVKKEEIVRHVWREV